MKTSGKWVEGLDAATPIPVAGARVLKVRLGDVGRLVRAARRGSESGPDRARTIHQLRIATRRAGAALDVFRPWVEGRAWDRTQKILRRARRAAGEARDADVRARMFAELRAGAHGAAAAGLEYLIGRVEKDRVKAERDLDRALRRISRSDWRRLRRRLARRLRRSAEPADQPVPVGDRAPAGSPTLADAARLVLPAMVGAAREAMNQDLARIEHVHTFRKAMKRLRYGAEVLAPALGTAVTEELYPHLLSIQGQMGEVNDSDSAAAWIADEAARLAGGGPEATSEVRQGVTALAERYRVLRDHRLARFLNAGGLKEAADVLNRFGAATRAAEPSHPLAEQATGPRPPARAVASEPGAVRLAAIDVGSNSTRLVIAEARPDGSYRVLDDERELTRLAHGLVQNGRLDAAVMDRAADVITRMRGIAEGYGCRSIRAVATAAVREADNGADFVALVRERAGLDLRVISAEEEASLAFLSASRAFGDMRTLTAGVVDIGGASTEVVLSSRGVVESVTTLPLGAVRLTEQFGGPDQATGRSYKEMREFIKEAVRDRIDDPPVRPEVLVGTGGTVTTLAAIAMHRESDAAGAAADSATAQGYQLRHETVKDILDELRGLSLEKRKRVPGLTAERADIIVAGIAVIEAVMKHLGAARLRVHERGVRDGVLLQMIRETFPSAEPRAGRRDRLGAARRLAQVCRSEEVHSEHVARLALQIFDGLTPTLPMPDDLWSGPAARELLEAGAVLHDIGYIVSYAKHHRHAYHLILHADALSEGAGAFTRREVQIVACLARYHRRADPDESDAELAGLSEEDIALTKRLVAVLRIADGLDRTHSQNVRAVKVRVEDNCALVELDAADDPATDIWGASRKSGLFEEAFGLTPRLVWTGAGSAAVKCNGDNVAAALG